MVRFMVAAITGGVIVWIWRDELHEYLERRTRFMRAKAADQLRVVQKASENALDTAKEQIRSALESGQEAIRPAEVEKSVVR